MSRKRTRHAFRPTIFDFLEDRVVPSHAQAAAIAGSHGSSGGAQGLSLQPFQAMRAQMAQAFDAVLVNYVQTALTALSPPSTGSTGTTATGTTGSTSSGTLGPAYVSAQLGQLASQVSSMLGSNMPGASAIVMPFVQDELVGTGAGSLQQQLNAIPTSVNDTGGLGAVEENRYIQTAIDAFIGAKLDALSAVDSY